MHLSSKALEFIGSHARALRRLSVAKCTKMKDQGLEVKSSCAWPMLLLPSHPTTCILQGSKPPLSPPHDPFLHVPWPTQSLAAGCPRLSYLNLFQCYRVTSVRCLRVCPLVELDMSGCTKVGPCEHLEFMHCLHASLPA